jgi:hypothetical protein
MWMMCCHFSSQHSGPSGQIGGRFGFLRRSMRQKTSNSLQQRAEKLHACQTRRVRLFCLSSVVFIFNLNYQKKNHTHNTEKKNKKQAQELNFSSKQPFFRKLIMEQI